jgi:hypothetical protein
MTDLSGAVWRKASGSAHNGGCVEVAGNLPGVTAVRDSKRPHAGVLVIDQTVFVAFLAEVRHGRYDLECSPTDAADPFRHHEIHDMTLGTNCPSIGFIKK